MSDLHQKNVLLARKGAKQTQFGGDDASTIGCPFLYKKIDSKKEATSELVKCDQLTIPVGTIFKSARKLTFQLESSNSNFSR